LVIKLHKLLIFPRISYADPREDLRIYLLISILSSAGFRE